MVLKRAGKPVVIKKYGNRRLYDTRGSRYITLHELAEIVRAGDEVRVVDAKKGDDLTQATLVQIILDGRGAAQLLPVALLTQLVRMGDDALAEFLGRYMGYALEMYLQARQGVQAMAPYNPFASMPFAAANNFARTFAGAPWGGAEPFAGAAQQEPARGDELAELREELRELKDALGKVRQRRK